MSLPLIKKQFIKHGLAVATASIMASTLMRGQMSSKRFNNYVQKSQNFAH